MAATAIEVNELIVGSQWTSLKFAIILTLITLAVVFRDIRYSIWTTSPVIATVALQWLVMWQMDARLAFVTVMIGSIWSALVSISPSTSPIVLRNWWRHSGHPNRCRWYGDVPFEAAGPSLGMYTAYDIPIPEITLFITVILILLWVAAASALVLLPPFSGRWRKWVLVPSAVAVTWRRNSALIRTAQTRTRHGGGLGRR